MRIHPGVRGSARPAGPVLPFAPALLPLPLLLLVAAAPAQAAAGADFQYVGQDDRVHGLTAPQGCVAAEGGGSRAATNSTRGTATFYREPGCAGRPAAVLEPGAAGQIKPYFASVRFSFITKAQRP
ncbi:hypothetical protein K7B10_05590 [Streptomyces flavotricini]|uniref:Secreted protein n=1 Tax=Streptomyces flavotricini TaxID=66888 RepID=A0ABS8DZG4_9ACTN|nr:hypothetical protein [Streptomyces flavotricini]MCC0094272.1 hypothetical protein [Streptomyces flavotricini]